VPNIVAIDLDKASIAALHHMDATAALGRMRDLLRPGGVLTVVGPARGEYPAGLAADLAAPSPIASAVTHTASLTC